MKSEFDQYDYLIFVAVILMSIFVGLIFGLELNEKFKNIFRRRTQISPCTDKETELRTVISSDANETKVKQQGVDEEVSQQDTEDDEKTRNFLTANSSMSTLPIALSLLATFFSSSNFFLMDRIKRAQKAYYFWLFYM